MKEFDKLVGIVKILRGKEGCPWDKEQTLESLKPYFLEEVAELLEAMESENSEEHKSELGDVLLHIIFQSSICEDEEKFNIKDVINGINEKLIRRHPHIFKEKNKMITADEVLINWEKIKKEEELHKNRKNFLDGIPKYLSSILKAQKIQTKIAKEREKKPEKESMIDELEQIFSNLEQIKYEIIDKNKKEIKSRIGDLLFSVVNISRISKIDANSALEEKIQKIIKDFKG